MTNTSALITRGLALAEDCNQLDSARVWAREAAAALGEMERERLLLMAELQDYRDVDAAGLLPLNPTPKAPHAPNTCDNGAVEQPLETP